MSDLKGRTKRFALDVIRYCRGAGEPVEILIIKRQLIRAATSVAANYRSACRGKSKADFIAKLSTVEEEADECGLWLEMRWLEGKKLEAAEEGISDDERFSARVARGSIIYRCVLLGRGR